MRRAIIATAGTVVGLVALLDYRSGGAVKRSSVAVNVGSGSSSTTAGSTTPSTTLPSTGAATTAPSTAAPSKTATTPASTAPASTAPPSTAAPTTTAPKGASGQFTGQDVQYRYGDIVVQISVSNGKITNINIPQESATDPRSQNINSQAIPILTQEALSAQSLNFDVVSGATFTSDAFAQSFQSALSQAGM